MTIDILSSWDEFLKTAEPCTDPQVHKVERVCADLEIKNPWDVLTSEHIPTDIRAQPMLKCFCADFFRETTKLQQIQPYQHDLIQKYYNQTEIPKDGITNAQLHTLYNYVCFVLILDIFT